jgi:Bacterial SH3 domain
MASCGGSSLQMIKRWLIALLIAGLFGGQAFADCAPSPDTPASVIDYFQKFNKPLPEKFCAKEHVGPQASDEPSRQPPQAYVEGGHYTQLTPRYAPHPESDKIDLAQPEQESVHAIVPDAPLPTPQATAPTAEAPTPQAGESSAEVPTPQSPAPSGTPSLASPENSQTGPQSPNDQSPTIVKDQLVTITSAATVRDGPSSSAKIIGRAYAGAMARVAATDSGWAQVVDPASGNKGWVEYSVLAPSTTTAATDDLPDVAAPDNWPEDQRADRSENRAAASKSKHSAEAKRHRAKHHHGRRRFVFRFAIRGFFR